MPPQFIVIEEPERMYSFTMSGNGVTARDLSVILHDIADLIDEGYDAGDWGIGTGSWQLTTEI